MSDLAPPPSGTGCGDCDEGGGWWFHLRRCVECGHVGCCDASPAQHARRHSEQTGHPVATSFEPGEHTQRRRLAAAGRPDQDHEFTGGEFDAHPIQRVDRALR